jgi:uncharacterized protein YbjT (DUF2867 family)
VPADLVHATGSRGPLARLRDTSEQQVQRAQADAPTAGGIRLLHGTFHHREQDVHVVHAQINSDDPAGKTHWPTGPESLSGNDVAEIFTRVLGRLITFYPISYEEQKQAMIDVGLPEPIAKDNALAVAWMADGDCDYVTEDLPQILGRPAGSFEQFAVDYAEAFS